MIKKALLMFTLLLGVSATIFGIETNLAAKVVNLDLKGGEIRESADRVNPGDILEYTFSMKNPGDNSEFQLKPIIPIPSEMILIPESISSGKFQVSVDGNNFIDYPVLDVDGNEVDPSAYKSVKWYIEEIKPKEQTQVQLRVKINS